MNVPHVREDRYCALSPDHRPGVGKRTVWWPFGVLIIVATLVGGSLGAAPTAAQKRQLETLNNRLRKAGQLYAQQRWKESATDVQAIQKDFQKLADTKDEELLELLEPLYGRLVTAREKLKEQGVEIPELKKPGAAGGGEEPVSFAKQVAPLLISKCGRCHVDNARGDFGMASYAQLMKGPPAGVVVFAGDDMGSRLVEVIETGDMPRGGGKVSEAEFALLKRWIKEGAKFDGNSEQASLRSLAPQAEVAEPKALAVVRSTGKESVSYAKEIAPVLAANCVGCHVNPQNARGNFNMTTFSQLFRGGDSGPPLVPGAPANSLLIQRLKGLGGEPRMPMGRPPIPDDIVGRFEKWIEEGATYDGGDANLNVNQVAALAKARSSSHEELTDERARLAVQNWRLGMPNVAAERVETDNFLLLGNVGEATLQGLGKQVESVLPRIADVLAIPEDQPLVKGRMTLFVFAQRYDYAEFGQMVEKRQIPPEWRGHWQFTVVDAYGAVIPPREEELSFPALAAQQVTGVYVASLGAGVPRWFAEGAGRAVASRIAPKDSRVAQWENELGSVLAAMARPDDFMTGKLSPEQSDVASYSFVKSLMRNNSTFLALLNGLRSGQDFDQVFAAVYRGTPPQVAGLWAAGAVRTIKRKR
ncbi:MAG: c-type cytochrome domain-containing protein [Pirellulaceae bacterium]